MSCTVDVRQQSLRQLSTDALSTICCAYLSRPRCADEQDEVGRWNRYRDKVPHAGPSLAWGRWAIAKYGSGDMFGGIGRAGETLAPAAVTAGNMFVFRIKPLSTHSQHCCGWSSQMVCCLVATAHLSSTVVVLLLCCRQWWCVLGWCPQP